MINKSKLHKQYWDRHDIARLKLKLLTKILDENVPIEDMCAIEIINRALTEAVDAGKYLDGTAYDGECS